MWGGANMFMLILLCFSLARLGSTNVSYDYRAIKINGQRRILLSGAIHYPRSTPEMWPDLIQKAKDSSLDVIESYVFWNGHEPSPGKYYFEDRFDLVKFIKVVHNAGLFFFLRIGPYVCAEWNFGGFPVWLKFVPGIEFRADNGPFKEKMQTFVEKIVNMLREEKLFQWQGGPVILLQIENEYGPVEWELGASAKPYAHWAAQMAENTHAGVPWVMCKQDYDVPDNVIDTCNGMYCEGFYPKGKDKPRIWTESWTGGAAAWGGLSIGRPAQDHAFAAARFIQNGGSFLNYYMFHGGTNFGNTAGRFVATSYDFDSPIDEYGMPREPKYTHLTNLHKAIKMCEPALVATDAKVTKLGDNQEAHVYWPNPETCAAFLANYDPQLQVTVTYDGLSYDLPPLSISILPDCRTEVYNTAKVSAQSLDPKMTPVINSFSWESYFDGVPTGDHGAKITAKGLREQLSVTWDNSDYLWYMTDVILDADDLKNGDPTLTVMSAGHVLSVFVNGQLQGNAYGSTETQQLTFSQKVKMTAGVNRISFLSATVGLANVGIHFENYNQGVLGPVTLEGVKEGKRDLSQWTWSYKIGMSGESLGLYTAAGSSAAKWGAVTEKQPLTWYQVAWGTVTEKQPLTWYKTTFNAPEGNDLLALDMGSMGKGIMWINGQSLGRHWPANLARGKCEQCPYAGMFTGTKCLSNCDQPSQRWYHVPRSWLKPTGNLLVVFEEWGGDPKGISLVKRTV